MGENHATTGRAASSNTSTRCLSRTEEWPAWLIVFLLASLTLVCQSATGFRVLSPLTDPEVIDDGGDFGIDYISANKRNTESRRRCYDRCQECRDMYGYNRYNYIACAQRCVSNDGRKWDVECTDFRSEIKRTSAERQQINRCLRFCKDLPNTPSCLKVDPFYVALAKRSCDDHCKKLRYNEARAESCSSVVERHSRVFSVRD